MATTNPQSSLSEAATGHSPNLLTGTIENIVSVRDHKLAARVQQHLDSLTKPQGSLGRLERVALDYSLATGRADWPLPRKALFVFCADHGVTAEGVSAFPPEVTHQMVENFLHSGAAVSVLCRQYDIDPVVVDMGVRHGFEPGLALVDRRIGPGTRNFLQEPAMSPQQAAQSIESGIRLAAAAAELQYGLLAIGEMGIGNTTAASAIVAAMSRTDAEKTVGPGTGISAARREHKVSVVRRALELHNPDPADPLDVLAKVGGFEIGGMCGFLLGAAAHRIPLVVDGFIATAAALLAAGLAPPLKGYLFFGHRSAEPGHKIALQSLGANPLLSLEMRLGEGTGAAIATAVIESALRLCREMATFASAQVSDKN